MPTEAQLKAQMQIAIAKKKNENKSTVGAQHVVPTPPPTPEPVVEIKPEIKLEPTPPAPVEEIKPVSVLDRRPPVAEDVPIDLTFYGHSVRYTTYHQEVYFAILDLLPLSEVPDYANKLIEFINNPKTKSKAETLIRVLTFPSPNGSEKTEGSTAINTLTIFREMSLTAPGPMGRWLIETAAAHKPKAE